MALFRRSDRSAARTSAFWDWWTTEGRALAEESIGGAAPDRFATAITAQLKPLGGFDWELAAGDTSEHVLVVTGGPDAVLRGAARRLLLAAPPADGTWSYADARPPAPAPDEIVLGSEGAEPIDFARVTVGARMSGNRFDVTVHHPAFADLDVDARARVAFLALDAALGEVDTELWLGEVVPSEMAPLDGFGLVALRSVVHDLKRQHLDADGRPTWVLLSGETPQGPLTAATQVPLHPLTAPSLDTYVAISLTYAQRTDDGLPADGSLEQLRAFEDRLDAELGTHGTVVAHQSVAGVRTLHVYVDGTAGLVPTIRTLAKNWPEGPSAVHDTPDPGWRAVEHLRT